MTIEFREFATHKLEKTNHDDIKNALLNCLDNTYFHWLNIIYNNSRHFNNMSYNYDINKFLKEIHQIANSPNDKLVVMGGIHTDTGHASSLILYNPKSNVRKALEKDVGNTYVSDTYIRFSIELKSPRRLSVLIPGQIYHFLVNNPSILWTSHKTGIFFIYNVPVNFDQETANKLFPIDNFNRPIIRLA